MKNIRIKGVLVGIFLFIGLLSTTLIHATSTEKSIATFQIECVTINEAGVISIGVLPQTSDGVNQLFVFIGILMVLLTLLLFYRRKKHGK